MTTTPRFQNRDECSPVDALVEGRKTKLRFLPGLRLRAIRSGILVALGLSTSCTDHQSDEHPPASNPTVTSDQQGCYDAEAMCTGYQNVWMCIYEWDGVADRTDDFVCAETEIDALGACEPVFEGEDLEEVAPALCADLEADTGGVITPSNIVVSITYDPVADETEIEDWARDYLIDHPWILLEDSARAEPLNPYYRLTTVNSGDIAAALGLQSGDKILKVNGMSLKHDADLGHAWNDLKNETTYELYIYNWPAGHRTETYTIVPN